MIQGPFSDPGEEEEIMERSVLKMPAVALRGMTILPGMITHFDVSRSRSAKAVERSVAQDQKLFVVTQKDPETENPDQGRTVFYGYYC